MWNSNPMGSVMQSRSLGCEEKSRDGCPPECHIKRGLVYAKDEWGVNAVRESAPGMAFLALSCQWEPELGFSSGVDFQVPDMSSLLSLSSTCYFLS